MAKLPNFLVIIRSEKLSGKGQGRGVGVRKKERFVLGKRTFRSQKSKHFVLRIIDVWIMRNKKYTDLIAEESVSIRAVRRVYGELSGEAVDNLTPKDIYDIAEGILTGNREAAVRSFDELGEMAGAAIVSALHIVDGMVVIGGGVAGAAKYILPGMMREMRRSISTFSGRDFDCLQMEVCNLMEPDEYKKFLEDTSSWVEVPFTDKKVSYDCTKRIGVAISTLGANKAIALGAYAFALQQIDKKI